MEPGFPHAPRAADTLAAIPFAEIKSVGLLTEQVRTTHADRTSTRKARYVELTLQTDTGPLKAAVAAERNRCAPEKRGRLGGSSTLKHHHYPVQVTGPRTVRLEALPGLLDAFTERVLLAPERRADLDAELEGLAADERARAYLHRGHRLEAIHIGRNELGLSKRKAKDWIADLDGRDAA